ncbi:MAG: hypothetical protein RBS17_11615 [Coriobacteriia bacterium]|nr:hypothetical protein [Coriobacteriia bacterium]
MTGNRWSLRNIYLYIVCLITLIMVIVGAATAVRSVVDLIYPDPGYYMERPLDENGKMMYSDEEWELQQSIQEESTLRYAVLSLVGSLSYVFIAGPIYVYHWRKIESEKDAKVEVAAAALP